MPLQDGSPNAAERRDAQRYAANDAFIKACDDATLAALAADPLLRDDELVAAQLDAEVARRKEAPQ